MGWNPESTDRWIATNSGLEEEPNTYNQSLPLRRKALLFYSIYWREEPGIMAHTYNPSILEAEAPGVSQNFSVGSTIAWEKCETLSPKDKKRNKAI